MGKRAKEHKKKVAKRNANIKQQERRIQKLWEAAFGEQMELMKEKFAAAMSGETTTDLTITPQIQNALENLLRNSIIPNSDFKIDYSWAGIMGVGDTKTPIVRKYSENVAFGVRMGGMGVAIGSLVGKELSKFF